MKKSKIVIGVLVFIVGTIGSVFLSMFLKLILAQNFIGPEQLSWGLCMESIASDRQHLMLFFCFVGVVFMLVIMLLMNRKTSMYESPLITITPKIKTPVAAGQKQYGSAAWLKRTEYSRVFGEYLLDPGDPIIKELMRHGFDDLQFMKKEAKPDEIKAKETKTA